MAKDDAGYQAQYRQRQRQTKGQERKNVQIVLKPGTNPLLPNASLVSQLSPEERFIDKMGGLEEYWFENSGKRIHAGDDRSIKGQRL